MNPDEFKKYFEERYKREMNWYDKRAGENKSKHYFFRTFVIAAGVLVPVLISIQLKPIWIAIGLATALAVAEGLSTFFKFQEHWINYRTTAETLRKEEYFYRAGVTEYADATDKEALFVQRVEDLISREHTFWITTAKAQTGKVPKPPTTDT